MSLIKLLNSISKLLLLLGFFILFFFNSAISETVDIWKKQENENNKNNVESEPINKNKSLIDISKKDKNLDEIKISENNDGLEKTVQLHGLYDPGKNDLTLNMWAKSDGAEIKKIFKRIEKSELSNFSEKIFIDTIFTYSYPARENLSEDEFLKLKTDWLIKKNKLNIIEEFLNTNLEFSEKSKLIKHLVDHYISKADISEGCEKINFINKEIKDNYLEKFRVYCLILDKKDQQAQLNFDLLREEGRSDKFFNNKILFLLGLNEKPDNIISDKNLLYFYLSSITVENFKYEPTKKLIKIYGNFLAPQILYQLIN